MVLLVGIRVKTWRVASVGGNVLGIRGQRRRRGTNRTSIPNSTDIDMRPSIVNDRERYGDWECDLIEGTRHSGYFLTLVERKSRFGILKKISCKKSTLVSETITSALQGFLLRTLTYDNGTEFARHESVNRSINCSSYFCKPYASWEKGVVENFNGVVRDFYPKSHPLSNISQADLDSVSIIIIIIIHSGLLRIARATPAK